MRKFLLASAALAMVAACGGDKTPADTKPPVTAETAAKPTPETVGPAQGSIAWAVAGDWRGDGETARDDQRNPIETLEFFGIQPDHKVVEIWPGGGWYTNILAPYLAVGGGKLVAVGFDVEALEGDRRTRAEERVSAFKETYSDPRYGTIEHSAFSKTSGALTDAGSADAVLTFRNVHNWMGGGYPNKLFEDAFVALKPGGILGVVEHRLPSAATQSADAASGYVHEDFVIALAEAAGFELVSKSEINANPLDTADHPYGVWTLPPVSRTQDREGNSVEDFDASVYEAIGESDRMTLKFVKPS